MRDKDKHTALKKQITEMQKIIKEQAIEIEHLKFYKHKYNERMNADAHRNQVEIERTLDMFMKGI